MRRASGNTGFAVFGAAGLTGLIIAGLVALENSPSAAQTERRVPATQTQVELSFASVVKEVVPAVVNIYTRRVVEVRQSPFMNDPIFRRFFGERGPFGVPKERVLGSLGSGVIVSADGIVVTNNHVISKADSIRVVLPDRREFEAQVVLADPRTDLAILRVDAGGEALPYLEFRDSDEVEVGDLVLAIGNPFGIGQTVTSGIISATARTQAGISDYQFFLQTDAAINPGNSGGALVAMDGRLIGVNTAIFSRSGENNGLGFAIPSNMVGAVLKAALSNGTMVRHWLGARGRVADVDVAESLGLQRPGGVVVEDIYANSPADYSDIRPGDVILKVNERDVLDPAGMEFRLATVKDPGNVELTIFRNGGRHRVTVELVELPETPPRTVTVLDGRHPFQGVTVANLSPRYADELGFDPMDRGVVVTNVSRRSPAGRMQFVRPGDVITFLNEKRIARVAELNAVLEAEATDYFYRLRRRGRLIECGIRGGRSFFCR
jgi:serine protease Do